MIILIIGASIMALGGTLLILSNIGGDAILVFEQGFSLLIGFSPENIGYGILIMNTILCIIMFFLDRKMLNIGTFVVVLLMGPFIKFLMTFNLIASPTVLINQIFMSLVGCIAVSFGVSLYLFANLGYAPFEGILIVIQKKLNVRFSYVKISSDIILFLIGWLIGGTMGIGSLFTIIIFGPLIDLFLRIFNKISKKVV